MYPFLEPINKIIESLEKDVVVISSKFQKNDLRSTGFQISVKSYSFEVLSTLPVNIYLLFPFENPPDNMENV